MESRAFGGQIGVGAIQGRRVHGLVEELPGRFCFGDFNGD